MEVRTFNQNQKDNPHESVYAENHPKRDRTAESRRRARQRVESLSDDGRKAAARKRYTTKTPITAAELLNDRLRPMLEDNGTTVRSGNCQIGARLSQLWQVLTELSGSRVYRL